MVYLPLDVPGRALAQRMAAVKEVSAVPCDRSDIPSVTGAPMADVADIRLGDRIKTRKAHPCGSDEWIVIRTGADIKMKCCGCGRIVMMDRQEFLKRRKKTIVPGPMP